LWWFLQDAGRGFLMRARKVLKGKPTLNIPLKMRDIKILADAASNKKSP
jgi:hypothetical protein